MGESWEEGSLRYAGWYVEESPDRCKNPMPNGMG